MGNKILELGSFPVEFSIGSSIVIGGKLLTLATKKSKVYVTPSGA